MNYNLPYHAKGDKALYYSEIDKCYIFDYYKNKSLPLFGWYKPCMICVDLTNNNFKFIDRNKRCVQSFICNECNKKYSQFRIKLHLNKLLVNSFIPEINNKIKDPSKVLIKQLESNKFCKNLLEQDI